jgi:hypothetical protein
LPGSAEVSKGQKEKKGAEGFELLLSSIRECCACEHMRIVAFALKEIMHNSQMTEAPDATCRNAKQVFELWKFFELS